MLKLRNNTKLRNSNTGYETILTFKRTFFLDSAFIKMEIVFRNFVPRRLLATWSLPDLYFDLLTNEIKDKHATETCQTVNSLRQ